MITLLVTLVILSVIFWALCEFLSAFIAVIFLVVATGFLLKMAKEIFK